MFTLNNKGIKYAFKLAKIPISIPTQECKGLCYSAESDAGTLLRKDIPKLPKELSKVEIFLKVKNCKYSQHFTERKNQTVADVVVEVQNTGTNTKQLFLLLSDVQVSKLFKT